jgi:hypothetical protein
MSNNVLPVPTILSENHGDSESRAGSPSQPGTAAALKATGRQEYTFNELTDLDGRVDGIKKMRAEGPKEGDGKLPVTVDHSKGVVLLPFHMIRDEGDLLGLIVIHLTALLGYTLIGYEGERYHYNEPTREVRNFFIGFLIGIDDKVNLRLSEKTNAIELGRACSYAIRVRGYFRNDEKLTSASLRKNQAFFGNDAKIDPKTKLLKKAMLSDNYLKQWLVEEKDGPSLKKAIVTLLEKWDLQGTLEYEFPEQILTKSVHDNVIEFTTLSDPYRRIPKGDTRPKKKDSKKATAGKLPDKPSQSPLMTQDEIKYLNSFYGPLWSNLTTLQAEWSKSISSYGYASVKQRIDLTFKIRWECLEALATVTTRRLRELKTHENDSKLTKRKVTKSDFDAWYALRPDSKAKWLFELNDLLKPIRSLSREQVELLGYTAKVWDDSRKLAAQADDLRLNRSSAQAEQPEGLKTSNRFDLLGISEEDAKSWQDMFGPHKALKEFTQITVVSGPRTIECTFLKDNLSAATNVISAGEYWLHTPELRFGFEYPNGSWAIERNRTRSGPNTHIGKLVNFFQKEGIIEYTNQKLVKGHKGPGKTFGRVPLGTLELLLKGSFGDNKSDEDSSASAEEA